MTELSRRHLLAAGAASALAPAMVAAAPAPVMVLLSGIDIPNFDPHQASSYPVVWLMRNTYDTLVGVAGDPPLVTPRLTPSWTRSEDGKEYVFKLDPSARFHGGGPVDAEAVAYSFERLLRVNRGPSWMLAGILKPGYIDDVDATTVRFRLSDPFAPFLETLPWFWIVDPKQVQANLGSDDGQTWLRSNVAGSGPFTVKRAVPGDLLEIARAPDGWRKGGGNLGGAIWKVTREASTQRLLLQRGDALVIGLTGEDIDALKDRPGVELMVKPEYHAFRIKMNTRHGPPRRRELAPRRVLRIQLPGHAPGRGLRRVAGRPAAEGHVRVR